MSRLIFCGSDQIGIQEKTRFQPCLLSLEPLIKMCINSEIFKEAEQEFNKLVIFSGSFFHIYWQF